MANQNTREEIGNAETLTRIVENELVELIDDAIYELRNYAFRNNKTIESVTLPNIRKAGQYAFQDCTRLTTVNLGYLHNLSSYLFYGCTSLDTVYAAETETSGTGPFYGCTKLVTVHMPELLSLSSEMFRGCTKLENVHVPKLKSGGSYAFYGCTSLEEIDLRALTSVAYSMFQGCTKLRSVILSRECSSIGYDGFYGCTSMTEISFPNVTSVSAGAFSKCTALSSVSLPRASSIGSSAFSDVPISSIRLPSATSFGTQICSDNGAQEVILDARATLSNMALSYDYNLTSLVLNAEQPCIMSAANALDNTPIRTGYGWIYVRPELVNDYREATNWSQYAEQIVSQDEYPKALQFTIRDSWEDIFAAEEDGTYLTKYSVGDTAPLTIDGHTYVMRIIGIDEDDRADGEGKAHITWMTLGLYHSGTIRASNYSGYYRWDYGYNNIRAKLRGDIFNGIDSSVSEHIVPVTKVTRGATSGTSVADYTSTETVWIPSAREVGAEENAEQSGPVYSGIFTDDESRRIRMYGYACGNISTWWLRSMTGAGDYYYRAVGGARNESVNGQVVSMPGGDIISASPTSYCYFPICFCT